MKTINKLIPMIVLILLCGACSEKEQENPSGSFNTQINNYTDLIFSDIIGDLYVMEPLFTPDGNGGIYFMDHDNYADHQEIYYIDPAGNRTETGLNPVAIAEALGYEIYAAGFENLGCDSLGGLFISLYLTAGSDDFWILRGNTQSHEVSVFASKSQLEFIYGQTPLGAWYRTFLRTQMMVCPDGTLWLYSNNGEAHVFINLYYQADQLNYIWWQIPTPTQEPDHMPLTGLTRGGDILLTEIDAAVVWRCNRYTGVSGFLTLTGFPNTVSGIAMDGSGNLHFATNYVLNYDITIIQTGYNGEVTLTSSYFTEGIDWLLFARASETGYQLFGWESTAFVGSFERPYVPAFWSFIPDPVSGEIYTMDESNGDIYHTSFSAPGTEKKAATTKYNQWISQGKPWLLKFQNEEEFLCLPKGDQKNYENPQN